MEPQQGAPNLSCQRQYRPRVAKLKLELIRMQAETRKLEKVRQYYIRRIAMVQLERDELRRTNQRLQEKIFNLKHLKQLIKECNGSIGQAPIFKSMITCFAQTLLNVELPNQHAQ